MSNKTLIYLTLLVIAGMVALFAINMQSMLTGQPNDQTYLQYNQVRGMAISHQGTLFTLNFKQQNEVIDILNRAVRLTELNSGRGSKSSIEKIIVYQFNDKPDLIFEPVQMLDKNMVFSVPVTIANGYLMEISNGRLINLLSQTYDR